MRVALILWLLSSVIVSHSHYGPGQFTAHCNYNPSKNNQLIDSHDFRSVKNMLRLHRTHQKQKSSFAKASNSAKATSDKPANMERLAKIEHHLKSNDDTYNRQERLSALYQTRCTGGQRTKRVIPVDEKIYAYAREYEIPDSAFAQRAMNEYEYQLHKEFVEKLTQAQQLKPFYNQAREHTVLLDIIGHTVAFGMEANQQNHAATATYWCDIAWKSLDLASAVGEGVALGMYNTAAFVSNAVRHPVETIQAVGHGVASIVTMLAQATGTVLRFQALEERGYSSFALQATADKHKQLDAELDALVDQMNGVIHHCSDRLTKMPLREKVKHITAFGTELIIPGKAFKVIHNVCSRMKPLAIGLFHALRDDQKAVQVAARVEGVAENIGMMIVEGVQEAAGAAKIVLSEAQLLLQSFHVDLMRRLEPEIAALRVLFDNKVKGFGEFANKYLKIDYHHILGMDLSFNAKGALDFGGFHHDLMEAIEKANVIKFTNKLMGPAGCYKADIIVGEKLFRHKTFFSAEWSREKVISKIYEAYQEFVLSGRSPILQKNGTYKISGVIKEGIEINIYVTKKGRINTAYPLF